MDQRQKIALLLPFVALAVSLVLQQSAVGQNYTIIDFPHNSLEADFSAAFWGDDIVFCSSRSRKTTNYNHDSIDVFYTDLFLSKFNGSDFSIAEPLKGNVNTFYNEGQPTFSADGKTMYYTANLTRKTGKGKSKTDEFKLGIFEAKRINDEWIVSQEFEHNSKNSRFSSAHPCLAHGDSVLYFSSNRPGGYGGADIYRCFKDDDGWSEPQNLGPDVNDEGNEFFPFVNQYGILFFTSDGRYDSEGMDIYCSYPNGPNEFEPAFRLNNTINTSFDELAYSEKRDSNMGCFSSNRNNGQDDIFLFTKKFEQESLCKESSESVLCYRFVDENLENSGQLGNRMPIVYNWDLGDGTFASGDVIEHCYQSPGEYTVFLSAYDTVTKMVFAQISQARILISDPKQPIIYIPDTVYANGAFLASVRYDMFDEFKVNDIKWTFDDGTTFSESTLKHQMSAIGHHQLRCELLGERKVNGSRNRVCLYREFYVCASPDDAAIPEILVELPKQAPLEIKMKTKSFGKYSMDDLNIKQQFYKLIIAESVNPISFEDSIFMYIEGEISEIKTDKGYVYAIDKKDDWKDLFVVHDGLKSKGLQATYAELFDKKVYDKSLVRTGYYSKESVAVIAQEISNNEKKVEPTLIVQNQLVVKESLKKINKETVELKQTQPILKETIIPASKVQQNDLIPAKKATILYHIIIESNDKRIPFTSSRFKDVTTEIAEMRSGNGFKYAVLTASNPTYLQEPLKELRSIGFSEAHIVAYDLQAFSSSLVKVGKYIQPENTEKLNVEFAKISDIKFEYNSSEILPVSFKNLDYIASMLMLEDAFMLRINAHTCNIGNSQFNKELSERRAQAVVDYFVNKGIRKERLIAKGYGDSRPATSNFSVDGRSANRRVEFIIVFDKNR